MSELPTASIKWTSWNSQVYEPSDDSFLLVDALQLHAPNWTTSRPQLVVEIGSGSGFVIASAALMLDHLSVPSRLIAVDINPVAAKATRETLQNHGVSHLVQVVEGDLLNGLGEDVWGCVDVLIFNPPYVPTPDEEVTRDGIARAWAGGHRGRVVIDRVLQQLPSMLSAKGEVFMVTVAENNPAEIMSDLKAQGFSGSIVMTRQADEETLSIVHLQRAA